MKNLIKILEYSAASNKESAKKLTFKGDHNSRPAIAIKEMVDKAGYELISVRDISYIALEKVKEELRLLDYKMYISANSAKTACRFR